MEQTGFKLLIKSLDDTQGTFQGVASTYGNTDLQNDIVLPGAFTKSIGEQSGVFPLLWQHRSDYPIGSVAVSDTVAGLQVDGTLVLESQQARESYALLKAKVVKGLSIGFDLVKSYAKDGKRYLQEIRLWEVSLVTFGANPQAVVSAVKTLDDVGAELHRFREVVGACRKHFRR